MSMRYHKNKKQVDKAIDKKVYEPRRKEAKTLSHFATFDEYFDYLEKTGSGIPYKKAT